MDFGVCDKCALIVLGATFSLFFSVTHKSESSSMRMKPPSQSLTGGSVIHLRSQAATISLQESLYPLLPPMLSVYWQVPRQQPSPTPAPLWRRRTAPAEVWVASNDSVATEKRLTMSAGESEDIQKMLVAV